MGSAPPILPPSTTSNASSCSALPSSKPRWNAHCAPALANHARRRRASLFTDSEWELLPGWCSGLVGVDNAAAALPAYLDYFSAFDQHRDVAAAVVQGAHAGVGLGIGVYVVFNEVVACPL